MQLLKEDIGSILQSGREITGEEIDEVRETVNLFPSLSRCELAHTICEHLGWFTATGSCKRDACLKLLDRLEAKGLVKLPAKRASPVRKRPRIVFTSRTDPRSEICGSIGEIGPIRVDLANGRDEETLCREYVSRYHYLGCKKSFGCSLSYFIESPHELLGCLLFQGAAKALRVRDKWIGWTKGQRLRNLPW